MLSCVEIRAGGGGQALGLEQAGFAAQALVEIDGSCCATLRMNRPHWNVVEADVRQFSGTRFRGVDLLAGGVPCPPFSVAGKQEGEADDRDLFPEALRLVDEIRPRAVMLENVRGFLDPKFDSYREQLRENLRRLGYAADIHLNFLDSDQRPAFYESVKRLSLDGLLLVGDTSVGSMLIDDLRELAQALEIPVWFTLGNHCWWMAGTRDVRDQLRTAVAASRWLHWLDVAGPVELADGVSLVGVDNFAEEPWDHVSRKPKDWIYISDFVGHSTEERLAMSRKMAEEAAGKLRDSLATAAETNELVVAACHIPPRFPHDFSTAGECPVRIAPWLGSFACGEAIASVAVENPDTRFLVLSGHLHAPLRWHPRDNVELRVARAEYSDPAIEDIFDPVERVWLSQPSPEGRAE
jgi:hypothetical protein